MTGKRRREAEVEEEGKGKAKVYILLYPKDPKKFDYEDITRQIREQRLSSYASDLDSVIDRMDVMIRAKKAEKDKAESSMAINAVSDKEEEEEETTTDPSEASSGNAVSDEEVEEEEASTDDDDDDDDDEASSSSSLSTES